MAVQRFSRVLIVASSLAAAAVVGLAVMARASRPATDTYIPTDPTHASDDRPLPVASADGHTPNLVPRLETPVHTNTTGAVCQRIRSIICMIKEDHGVASVTVVGPHAETSKVRLVYGGCPSSVAATFTVDGPFSLEVERCNSSLEAPTGPHATGDEPRPAFDTTFADWIENPDTVTYREPESRSRVP